MRAMGFLIGLVMLPFFWPATVVIWMLCMIPPKPKPVHVERVGDFRIIRGRRCVLHYDGLWYPVD